MAILGKIFGTEKIEQEQRAQAEVQEPEKRNLSSSDFFALLTGGYIADVTEENAMAVPAVKAAVDLISNAVATMPVYLYKEKSDGSIENKTSDYRMKFLNAEPNEFLNGYNFKKQIVKDYLLHGASYTEVVCPANKVLELNHLSAKNVAINKKFQKGYKLVGADVLFTSTETGKQIKFKPFELMIALQDSADGLTSKGALFHGRKVLQQAIAEMTVAQKFFERGALPLSILKTGDGESLDEEQMKELQSAWNSLYGGNENAAKTVVLSGGMEYQQLSPAQIDTEISKKYASDIFAIFNLPEGMVTSAGRYQSLEQNQMHYLRNCLQPILTSLEAAMDKALLLESEKRDGYYFRFDTSELTRATMKELVETLVLGMTSGLFTNNEARAKLDLPPSTQDTQQFGSGTQLFDPKTGKPIVLNGVKESDKEIKQEVDSSNDETTESAGTSSD